MLPTQHNIGALQKKKQGPRSNFEIEGAGGGRHRWWLNIKGHKTLFLTNSL